MQLGKITWRAAVLSVVTCLATSAVAAPADKAPPPDKSPHKVSFVAVQKDVRLEVLDWGGKGRPLMFLAGLGGTAHVFDAFALRFTGNHRVIGITRRGFGASSKPDPATSSYTPDRLGDDVLAVIDALGLEKPVIAGHSISGQELSSIASRHPEKVSGLVYLDAAYAYSFYAPGNVVPMGLNLSIDANALKKAVDAVAASDLSPAANVAAIQKIRDENLVQLQADLIAMQETYRQLPPPPPHALPDPPGRVKDIVTAILTGSQKYTDLKAPILAFYTHPQIMPPGLPPYFSGAQKILDKKTTAQIEKFKKGNPSAKVVILANARHDIFNSNADEVAREMNQFMAALP